MNQYDYIIAGAGCAGLSMVVHMIQSGKFGDKKILIVDKAAKTENDRTWCFWETKPGLFESIVLKKWDRAWFHSENFSRLLELDPYSYKLIRGIDFYEYCFELIRQQPNIEMRKGLIGRVGSEKNGAFVEIDNEMIFSEYVFNSILFEKPVLKENEFYLLQHFRGWVIETEKPMFNPDNATLMDFRVGQNHGTTFVYVMPFSETKGLIEYTVFSEQLLNKEQYEEGLRKYIHEFVKPGEYSIIDEESGVIPMTNYKFPAVDGRVINIGTAGGQTKASSGYTFRFIQKHSARIVESLIKKKNPFIAMPGGASRFRFYDSTLLYILKHKKLPGDKVFTDLFKKNKPQPVLRFLDNESSFADELKIISSLPTLPFLKAAWKQR